MSQKRTAPTPHGDVEYEVVKCSSCNNEVAKEDAHRFVIGRQKRKRVYNTRSYTQFELYDDTLNEGWACPYCYDGGPIEYPTQTRARSIVERVVEATKPLWYDYSLDGVHPIKVMVWLVVLVTIGTLVMAVIA